MKNRILVLLSILAIVVQSCIGDGTKSENQTAKPASEEEKSMIGTGNDGSDKATSTGIVRYTMGEGNLATWGNFLFMSKWAKEIEDKKVTFLCPQDKIFGNGERNLITELKRPENKELLNRLMSQHILKDHYTNETLFTVDEVETIDGRKLIIDKERKTVNGIQITGNGILTAGGTVFLVEDVVDYPESELKASAARHMNKGK